MISLQKPAFGRGSWLLLLAMLFAGGLTTLSPLASSPAYAQAEEEGEEAPADDAEGEGGTTTAAEGEESFLAWTIRALSWWGLVFLIISFVMVALIMMCLLQIRRDILLPQDFVDAFEEKLANKDYQGAYDLAKNDESLVARVLAAGLSKLNRGYNEAIEGMQEVGEDENMAMEHRLSYLAMIGSIAPMIGLMGTVAGMIASFQVIAKSEVPPKPKELADGISTALFTTLAGLMLAIPAMVFYGYLRNRVARFVLEVGIVSEGLMSRFSTVGKRGGTAPTGAPASPEKST